jgi:hypothetical protein
MQGWRCAGKIGDWLWLLAWGVASSVWCVTAAGQLSATFDEPTYLVRGLERWRTGSYAGLMRLGTMPLPVDVETLPLYLWERWRGTPFDLNDDFGLLLPWARAGTLVFWWLLLIYGRLIGRSLAGPWGGRLAVALLACEPSLLAHASLATTDVAITACLLALLYHFHVGRGAGWLRGVGLPMVWFAAAVLAKASGLVFGPLCMAVVALDAALRKSGDETSPATRATWWPRRLVAAVRQVFVSSKRDMVQIVGGGLVLVLLYCGSDWRVETSWVKWARDLPDGPGARSMLWLAEHACIFSNGGEGLVQQIKHNIRSHGGAYLLGEQRERAFWYYFPVALSIKLSLALLLLPMVVALVQPRALRNWALAAAVLLLVFSLTCRVQIGIRLVLPLVALGVVGVAAAVARTIQLRPPGWRRTGLAAGVAAGVVWTVGGALSVWPEGLCYVNEAWGGPANGYRLLSDSNYDWGQGLTELARWQRQHDAAPLDVWYFGCDPAFNRLPMHALPLHVLPIHEPADVLAQVHGHYLAVSLTLLYGSATDMPGHREAAAFLRSCAPLTRTATFLIYDFTQAGTASTVPASSGARLALGSSSPRRSSADNSSGQEHPSSQ